MTTNDVQAILDFKWRREDHYHFTLAEHYLEMIEESIPAVLRAAEQEMRDVLEQWTPMKPECTWDDHPTAWIIRNDFREWLRRDYRKEDGRISYNEEGQATEQGHALYEKVWQTVRKGNEEERVRMADKWDKYLTNVVMGSYFDDTCSEKDKRNDDKYPFLHTMTLVLIYLTLAKWFPVARRTYPRPQETPAPVADLMTAVRAAGFTAAEEEKVREAFAIAHEKGWIEGDNPPFLWRKGVNGGFERLVFFRQLTFGLQIKIGRRAARQLQQLFTNVNVDSLRNTATRVAKDFLNNDYYKEVRAALEGGARDY